MDKRSDSVSQLVDNLFRREVGRMVSRLTRIFGTHHLDLVEDAVQYAMLQALQLWAHKGVPDDPRAWMMEVAYNRSLDAVKGQGRLQSYQDEEELTQAIEALPGNAVELDQRFAVEVNDEQLALIFVCCHPALPRPASVALTLKVVCGFGVTEIARAFLASEISISQRLVRAKRLIREQRIGFEVPAPDALPARLDSVLEVLYLLFTEGYAPTAGDRIIKDELCAEAIRLAELLAENPAASMPECHALLALMLFQAARFPTRSDAAGDLMLLEEQDRSLWDQSMIARGMRHMERAASGERLTTYHLQAEIAGLHASTEQFEQTNWMHILSLYDLLIRMQSTPVVLINRAIALGQVEGPAAGLESLEQIDLDGRQARYPFLPMAQGEFHRRLGQIDNAINCFTQALERVRTEPERRFIRRKIEDLQSRPYAKLH
jgi:RNA polymerase sigma-70 factor (ECF subfamily)